MFDMKMVSGDRNENQASDSFRNTCQAMPRTKMLHVSRADEGLFQ